MKKTILTFFLMTSLTIFAFGQQVQVKTVYIYADSTLVENLLDAAEIEYEKIGLESYNLKLNGFTVRLTIDEELLVLRSSFIVDLPLERVNDFNMRYLWVRDYMDENRNLTVAQELNFDGGLTVENISSIIDTYGLLLEYLIDYLHSVNPS